MKISTGTALRMVASMATALVGESSHNANASNQLPDTDRAPLVALQQQDCGASETEGHIVNLVPDEETFDEFVNRVSQQIGILNPLVKKVTYTIGTSQADDTTLSNVLYHFYNSPEIANLNLADSNHIIIAQAEEPRLLEPTLSDKTSTDGSANITKVEYLGFYIGLDNTFLFREDYSIGTEVVSRKITPSDVQLDALVVDKLQKDSSIDDTEKHRLFVEHVADYFLTNRDWASNSAAISQLLNGTGFTIESIRGADGLRETIITNIKALATSNALGMRTLLRNILNFTHVTSEGININNRNITLKALRGISEEDVLAINAVIDNRAALYELSIAGDDGNFAKPGQAILAMWVLKRMGSCEG